MTFPVATAKRFAKSALAATAPTVEIRDLSGTLVATVPLVLKQGMTYTYTAPNLDTSKDYIVKAVNGAQELRTLVDKSQLTAATVAAPLDTTTTAAVIYAEKKLNLTPGTLGTSGATTGTTTAALSNLIALQAKLTTLLNDLSTAIAAVQAGSATSQQSQLSTLVNAVDTAVAASVDSARFVADSSTATGILDKPSAISCTGKVIDMTASGNPPLAGTTVSVVGTALSTTTGSDGKFTLTGIAKGSSFILKMTKPGYSDNYSTRMSFMENTDISERPYNFVTPAVLTAWGNSSGKGLIRASVFESANSVSSYISGAVVTAIDASDGTKYPVKYQTRTNAVIDAASTDETGRYIVLNVPAGRTVNVTASRSGYTFNTRIFEVKADSLHQGRISGTAQAGAITFSQADLAGVWNVISFYTGPAVANGSHPGWLIGKVTIAGDGTCTLNSALASDHSTNNSFGGTVNWSINSTGDILESGAGGFWTPNTPAPIKMSSNKQITVGVASDGTTRVLRVAVKQVGTFSNSDVTGPFNYVSSRINSGTSTNWSFAQGTIDAGGVTETSILNPGGAGSPATYGALQIDSNGIMTQQGAPDWHGIMTPDKKMWFRVKTSSANSYNFGVTSVVGQTFSQADLAGDVTGFNIASTSPPTWEYYTLSNTAGKYAATRYLNSNGVTNTSEFGTGTLTIGPTGLLTNAQDASFHGFMSMDKKLMVLTTTWQAGVYGFDLVLH